MGNSMYTSKRTILRLCCLLAICVAGLQLVRSAAGVNVDEMPDIKALPAKLPSSSVKQDGKVVAVRSTADALKKQLTKSCPKCSGSGHIKVRGDGGGFARPE